MVTTVFPTFQDAVDAPAKTPEWIVLIAGIPTDVAEWSTKHGVYQPVGTAAIVLPPMDVPDHVTTGAAIEIQAGYTGVAATVFHGVLPRRGIVWSDDGTILTINAVGYGDWLARRDYVTVSFPGPVPLKTIYQSLALRRGVPSAFADDTTAPDGTTVIQLGGVAEVENGDVVIARKTASAQWINQISNLFGYYAFDLPSGPNRFQKVSGSPPAALPPVATFEQGVTGYRYALLEDLNDMVTYWEVKGARYTDEDGVNVEIRSIPAVVPSNPILGPDEYTRDEKSHALLVTIDLADIVRNVLEIDHSTPRQYVTWEDEGSPHIEPGEVVHVTAPALGVDDDLWVMSVTHRGSDSTGLETTFEGWAGSGEALAAGEDCVTQVIPGGPWHLGDESIPWYAVPAPSSGPIVVAFTAADYYSSLTVYARGHGCNSYMLTGKNSDSTVSRFEVWQFGEKVGEGNLPVLNENYPNRYPYGAGDTYWTNLVIPVTGSLEPGAAELRIYAGSDTRVPIGTRKDDFEIKSVTLRTCGVGEALLPGELP